MRYHLLATALVAVPFVIPTPAHAQGISGCGTTAVAKADRTNRGKLEAGIACFSKAGEAADAAIKLRQDLIAALTPAPTPSPTPTPVTPAPDSANAIWERCSQEAQTCNVPYKTNVRFGTGNRWIVKADVPAGALACDYRTLGDPAPGALKFCEYQVPGDALAPLPSAAGFKLGMNLTTVTYYSGEPTLANLLTGGHWVTGSTAKIDPINGITLPAGQGARLYLTTPVPVLTGKGAQAICSWEGTASVTIGGLGQTTARTSNSITFNWTPWTTANWGALVWLDVASTGSDGARNFDCRLTSLPRDATLSPEVVDSLKPFKVLRFLDWSNVNGNPANVTWSGRTQPGALNQAEGPTGVALEHMIALVNATGAAPWFNVPWNADEDYQRRMAQLVHDSLPADREVYVELSNEVWNNMFGVTHQARAEGMAAGLSTNQNEAVALRYAQKVRWMMEIWAKVFADRPGKLVRVAGSQTGGGSVELLLNKGQLAGAVDAVAIAPYIGGNIMAQRPSISAADALTALDADIDAWEIPQATDAKNAARKFTTRIIMYEGGQHLTGQQVDTIKAVNRDPAIEGIYDRYIRVWRDQVGDAMILYNGTSPISQYGAWGAKEYVGQPIAETPKLRAILKAAAQ